MDEGPQAAYVCQGRGPLMQPESARSASPGRGSGVLAGHRWELGQGRGAQATHHWPEQMEGGMEVRWVR